MLDYFYGQSGELFFYFRIPNSPSNYGFIVHAQSIL